jgi:hypothetical protein
VLFGSLDFEPSTKISAPAHNSTNDNMVSTEYAPIAHPTSKTSIVQQYSSLPYQHPFRFAVLCIQIFVYYLVYGYLQVSFIKIKNHIILI